MEPDTLAGFRSVAAITEQFADQVEDPADAGADARTRPYHNGRRPCASAAIALLVADPCSRLIRSDWRSSAAPSARRRPRWMHCWSAPRSAPFIREKKDFYTALFDADGVMVVGSMVPIFGDITGPVFARFPADDHARRRSLLVQRLLCIARRGLALQRSGVPGARVPRRTARGVRHGLGAFLRHRRPAAGLDQLRCHRHLPGRHHHSADEADRWRHAERGGAGDLLPQLPLSRDRAAATRAR